MLKFEEELEKYKMVLEINDLETYIATEDMRDVIDLIKEGIQSKGNGIIDKNDGEDREL